MKRYRIATAVAFGLLFSTTTATAWWQWYSWDTPSRTAPDFWDPRNIPQTQVPGRTPWLWYYQDVPFSPFPGLWFYQNLPQTPAQAGTQPWIWRHHSVPFGPFSMWTTTMPMSSLFVEQSHSPAGYNIRVHSGQPGTQDIDIGLEGHALVIKQHQGRHSSWSTQWVSLPADANVGAMRMSRGNGLVDIFIPRVR